MVFLGFTLMLATASGCRMEGDRSSPPGHLDPLAALRADRAVSSAGISLPSGDEGAPRGPRHDLLSMSRTELWAAWNSLRGDAYDLDQVERIIDDGTRITCDPKSLVSHRGTVLPYQGSVQVDPAFRERLVRFEQLAIEVAQQVYGRAPTRLRHFGAYACRSTRNRSYRMSEHALGNAIDIVGFDFARARKQELLPDGVPAALRGPFQVRVARHWSADANSPAASLHSRFLRELAARLSDRPDVFRGMIGPSRSDHSDHFHFDMSPWRYVYF
jgi:hypothetical protein